MTYHKSKIIEKFWMICHQLKIVKCDYDESVVDYHFNNASFIRISLAKEYLIIEIMTLEEIFKELCVEHTDVNYIANILYPEIENHILVPPDKKRIAIKLLFKGEKK